MRKIVFATLMFLFLTIGIRTRAEPSDAKCRAVKVLVVPFGGGAKNPSQAHFSLGLPAVLAERFDEDSCIESANGPLMLTREQAALLEKDGQTVDLAAANELAAAKGAVMFIGGSFGGRVESWTLTVDIYSVTPDGPRLAGTATASGPIYDKGLSPRLVHDLLSRAATEAFSAAGTPLTPGDAAAIARPMTDDGYAFLLLNRAYGRHFRNSADAGDTALSIAEYAVRVDPKFVEAQRFYAQLLAGNGRTKKARIHFEAVLQARPADVRSLIALGMIEIGQKNPDVAERYLKRAVTARPDDPGTHFWLGRAKFRLGDAQGAVTEFEAARRLDPSDMDTRRELVALYSADRQYSQASEELRAMTAIEPDNLDVVFQLAACLRAGGKPGEAAAVYHGAKSRFPKEGRLERFRQDLLDPKADGITELVNAVSSGKVHMDRMEDARQDYQIAANDAVIGLTLGKKEGCDEGRGAAALAKAVGNDYAARGKKLGDSAAFMRRAFERGDGAALAPDEAVTARQVLAYADKSERDLLEMTSLYRRSVGPIVARTCDRSDQQVRPASIAEVRDRNEKRYVKIEPAKPSAAGSIISPEVPPDPARIVRFTVRNTTDIGYLVFLDDDAAPAAAVPAKQEAELKARAGSHRLCIVAKGAACRPADYRQITLHDLWTMTVKQ